MSEQDDFSKRPHRRIMQHPVTGERKTVTVVDFEVIGEPWSTYALADGTELRVKHPVQRVMRIDGEFTPEGEPVYIVIPCPMLVTNIMAPDHLLRVDARPAQPAPALGGSTARFPQPQIKKGEVIDVSGHPMTSNGQGGINEIDYALDMFWAQNSRYPDAIIVDSLNDIAKMMGAAHTPDVYGFRNRGIPMIEKGKVQA